MPSSSRLREVLRTTRCRRSLLSRCSLANTSRLAASACALLLPLLGPRRNGAKPGDNSNWASRHSAGRLNWASRALLWDWGRSSSVLSLCLSIPANRSYIVRCSRNSASRGVVGVISFGTARLPGGFTRAARARLAPGLLQSLFAAPPPPPPPPLPPLSAALAVAAASAAAAAAARLLGCRTTMPLEMSVSLCSILDTVEL
eukprot:scaffold27347_cov69-Phaeocystis_antarctica.AAC.1